MVIFALSAMVLAGAGKVRAGEPINSMCPVLTQEEADPAITTQYQGKTIAFCCDHCRKKFQADPEKYASRLAAFHHHEGDEHDQDEKMPLLARFHPVVVHLPLAGVPIALVAVVGWLASRRRFFALGDIPPLVVAATASIAAVITGNLAHHSMRFSASLHEYVEWHQCSATALMIVLVILCVLRLWRWRRLEGRWLAVYVTGLVLACCLVVVVGYLGGSLVFGPDHLKL